MSTETFIGVNIIDTKPFCLPQKNIVCYVMQTYSGDSSSGFVVTDSQHKVMRRVPTLDDAFNFGYDHLGAVKFVCPIKVG